MVKNEYIEQYKIITDDMRFYADQRFKILTVYSVVNGFMINFLKDYDSIEIGFICLIFSLLLFFWEARTTIYWNYLNGKAGEIENRKRASFIRVYGKDKPDNKWYHIFPFLKPKIFYNKWYHRFAFLSPTSVCIIIYIFGFLSWGTYLLILAWKLKILKELLEYINC